MPEFTETFANPQDAEKAADFLGKVGYAAHVDPHDSNTVRLNGHQPVRFSRRQLGGRQAEAEAILSRAGLQLVPDPANPDSVQALKGQQQ
jgi:hypothetical protein